MVAPCLELEIGLTLGTMRELVMLGIPDPSQWQFVPYSRVEIGGDGRPRGFGFPTASWIWDILNQEQLAPLLDLFATDSDAAVQVYIWTYQDSGSGLGQLRRRFRAYMTRPVDGSGKSMYPESRSPFYTDVTLSFSHLEAV